MSPKYYIRPRKDENPKKCQGPFDLEQLRQLAGRKQFSKQLHEYSEDRLNWGPAKDLWGTLFPSGAKLAAPPAANVETPSAGTAPTFGKASPNNDTSPNEFPTGTAVQPAFVLQEPTEWYYLRGGVQQPPVALSELRRLAAAAVLQPTDLVWNDTMGEQWVEAQWIPELFAGGVAVQGAESGSYTPGGASGSTPPLAVASFVMGLLGTSLLLGLGSILAIVFGHLALAEFRRNPAWTKGRGLALTGLILGYAMLGILVIASIVFIALAK